MYHQGKKNESAQSHVFIISLKIIRRMENANNNNDSRQNDGNQEVLKIEVFHGRNL